VDARSSACETGVKGRGGRVAIVVQKYGGSSVADLDRIRAVAGRIAGTREAGHAVVAVVSAMGNTTNELLALAHQVSAAPDRRELDMLLSVGERITMALLALALRERGVPAVSLTGSQSGIITDEAHADARVVEVRPARLQQVLGEGKVAIIAGFQGVSRQREVTTLGRGGSDTTAVVLAAALGAAWCEICSDVDGVWSADPRVVPAAIKLDTLSLDQALALARGGAKVLYEDAVRFARDNGVEITASATTGPGSGSRIGAAKALPGVAVAGDAGLRRVALGADPDAELEAIAASGGRVRRVVGAVVYVDVRNAHGGLRGVGEAPAAAMVTAVGSALGEDPARVRRATRALAELPVRASGAEGDVAWWEVAPADLDEAVRRVHGALYQTPNVSMTSVVSGPADASARSSTSRSR
jgi:aspartate kinase